MKLLIGLIFILNPVFGKIAHKVRCVDDRMLVDVVGLGDVKDVYLEHLKDYPDPACKPTYGNDNAVFNLSLSDVFQCGITRISNQITGKLVFYHRIVVDDTQNQKKAIIVKCVTNQLSDDPLNKHRLKRQSVLPAGFQEPEDLEITKSFTKTAPEPMLNVGVRQGGNIVTGELNVNPGTPLQMEIFLDKESSPIYGLLMSYMKVTDMKSQEETIIFNGCSVDPYLFENFNTVDGDYLSAKFRAFKFPESTYVQFQGTVNVCLDKCRGVECSNGQIGYGRKKREVEQLPPDPNKIFEVTMTTFIRVDYKGDSMLEKGQLGGVIAEEKKKTSGKTTDMSNAVHDDTLMDIRNQHLKLETEEVGEEIEYTILQNSSSAAGITILCLLITAVITRLI